jgi:hypothetical protein
VYDMYPWDSDSQGDYPPEPLRSWRDPNPRDTPRNTPRETSRETSPAQAVQTALDRRDNGGDAAGTRAAGTRAAAAASHHAGPRATPPTTSLARQ